MYSFPILFRIDSCVENNFSKSKFCFRKRKEYLCAKCCTRRLVFTAQANLWSGVLFFFGERKNAWSEVTHMLNAIDTQFSKHSVNSCTERICTGHKFVNVCLISYQGSDDSDFKYRGGVSPTLNYTGWLFDTNSWSQMVYERYLPPPLPEKTSIVVILQRFLANL